MEGEERKGKYNAEKTEKGRRGGEGGRREGGESGTGSATGKGGAEEGPGRRGWCDVGASERVNPGVKE